MYGMDGGKCNNARQEPFVAIMRTEVTRALAFATAGFVGKGTVLWGLGALGAHSSPEPELVSKLVSSVCAGLIFTTLACLVFAPLMRLAWNWAVSSCLHMSRLTYSQAVIIVTIFYMAK